MCRKVSLLFFAILSVCSAHCQNGIDRLGQKYRAGAIWLDMPHYYKGSERIHYSGLKNEFNVSANGLIEYEVGIRKYRTGRIIGFVAVASSFGALFTINSNRNLSIGLFAGSVLINTIGLKISFDGRKRLQHAIFIRNRDLLFPPPIR